MVEHAIPYNRYLYLIPTTRPMNDPRVQYTSCFIN